MKALSYLLALVLTVFFMVPVSARTYHYRHVYTSQSYTGGRDYRDCALAARLGGPCGCEAMKRVGITNIRFWRVSSWYAFPATSPHIGAAALWGQRHVEIVTAVHGDSVTTDGPYGLRVTRIAYLHFVEPHSFSTTSYQPRKVVWNNHRNQRYGQHNAWFEGGRWPAI